MAEAAGVEREDVLRAAEVIRGRVHRTPTFTSRSLGPGVYLKAELFQHTGSFKPRGVLNKLASLTPEEKARGVIGISAGNHAAALAWGAAEEGVDCLVVMISGASRGEGRRDSGVRRQDRHGAPTAGWRRSRGSTSSSRQRVARSSTRTATHS